MLCLTAPTFVGRESGVCDTDIPHYNPFVVMVITDGCLQAARKQQVINTTSKGLAVRQMQQDLLITDWALCPSAYPLVTQSVVFDGALRVWWKTTLS